MVFVRALVINKLCVHDVYGLCNDKYISGLAKKNTRIPESYTFVAGFLMGVIGKSSFKEIKGS